MSSRSSFGCFERIISNPNQGVEHHMELTFAALGVSANVVEALASNGINEPFNIQTLALPDAIAGLDILGKAPTGSGKTLAFAVPIVERTDPADKRPAALVLVPTRELALQVAETL